MLSASNSGTFRQPPRGGFAARPGYAYQRSGNRNNYNREETRHPNGETQRHRVKYERAPWRSDRAPPPPSGVSPQGFTYGPRPMPTPGIVGQQGPAPSSTVPRANDDDPVIQDLAQQFERLKLQYLLEQNPKSDGTLSFCLLRQLPPEMGFCSERYCSLSLSNC
jgi:hypothetical protein